MGNKIAIVGVGAVGGYTGAHMARGGEDVTFIDMWPAHVDQMKTQGLLITHHQGEQPFTVKVRALHLTEAQQLSKERPFDIAFVCTKSYDTQWAATLIKQYLAPGGYVVSLQNCMNEETIAGVVGWGKTMGCIASNISVGLVEPGRVHRGGSRAAPPTRSTAPAKCMAGLPTEPRRYAGSSLTPTAPRSPTIYGASAGRSLSPIRWRMASPPPPG
jgi:2-dehydropantoate 2-reductase